MANVMDGVMVFLGVWKTVGNYNNRALHHRNIRFRPGQKSWQIQVIDAVKIGKVRRRALVNWILQDPSVASVSSL